MGNSLIRSDQVTLIRSDVNIGNFGDLMIGLPITIVRRATHVSASSLKAARAKKQVHSKRRNAYATKVPNRVYWVYNPLNRQHHAPNVERLLLASAPRVGIQRGDLAKATGLSNSFLAGFFSTRNCFDSMAASQPDAYTDFSPMGEHKLP